MARSSKESLTYERAGSAIHIQFYYDPPHGFEYVLPENVQGNARLALIEKIELYCRRKRVKVAKASLSR
jgi:hypothetical protein